PHQRYAPPKNVQLHQQLEQRIAAVPGVEDVAQGWIPYISESMGNADFVPEGETFDEHKDQAEYENAVGNRFFSTLQIPIIAGRGFGAQYAPTSLKVAVINQSLARKRFANVNPIGRRFEADRESKNGWIQIVGICADTKYANLRDDAPAQFFLPYVQQDKAGTMVYQVRTRMQAGALIPALRQVVQSVDRDLPMI